MTITQADGVFQGGGMKGLAIAGALLEFADHGEEVRIDEWVNVAGTSAGAIIAAYLATGHGPDDVAELLQTTPYHKLQDWGRGGPILGGAWNLLRRHGIARGECFRTWLDEQLGHSTFAAVKRTDPGTDKTGDPYRLRMIAADVSRHEMLVLPADLAKYRLPGRAEPIEPDAFPIADAVRMSMSIPYFFAPVSLTHHETNRRSTIVDGGILSNFPVWLFDVSDRAPRRPTFGFHLYGGRGVGGGLGRVVERLGWPARLGADIMHTATDAWDTRFMSHSTVVRTCAIDADGVGTTDFGLDRPGRQKLVDAGRAKAHAYLDQFEIKQYVNTFGRKLAG